MRSTNKKFFGAAVFQKCCRGVGEQPTFAEQMKLYNQKEQKSKSKSEESQLPLKLEGSNEGKGFRGNCDSQASWGCAPALPNQIVEVFLRELFSVTSRRQLKSFLVQQFYKNAAEVWASSPHLRSKSKLHNQMQWYPKGIAFFQTMQKTPCNTIKNRL